MSRTGTCIVFSGELTEILQMTRVTFRVASSPYLAVQALQQTAQDFGGDFPRATPHVTSSFYVDDLLARANTPEEATLLQSELR